MCGRGQPVNGVELAVNAVLETHAGRPFEEAGAALRVILRRLGAHLDEGSLHAFAVLIAAGLPVEVRWRRDPCPPPGDPAPVGRVIAPSGSVVTGHRRLNCSFRGQPH